MKVIKLGCELYPQNAEDNSLFAHCIGEKGLPKWKPSTSIIHKKSLETVLKAHGETLEIIEQDEKSEQP